MLGIVGIVIIVLIAAYFTNYLGTRVLSKNSARTAVHQGDKVAIQFSNVPNIRKLEICTDKITNCATLQATVNAHATRASITVPIKFPLGKAVVLVRTRDDNWQLLPSSPSDEKIPLLIIAAKKPTPTPVAQEQGSGGSGGGGGGGNGGGGSSNDNASTTSDNSYPPFSQSYTSDGRTMTIQVDHSELYANQTDHVTVTYALNEWPGTYQGNMQVFIQSPDVSNFSPSISDQRFWDEVNPKGTTMLVWPYSIPNGQSSSFSFDVKVPPVGYKSRNSLEIVSQLTDTYGPLYLNWDGTATQGNLNLSRTFTVTLPIH